jgi:hypothetical protein
VTVAIRRKLAIAQDVDEKAAIDPITSGFLSTPKLGRTRSIAIDADPQFNMDI